MNAHAPVTRRHFRGIALPAMLAAVIQAWLPCPQARAQDAPGKAPDAAAATTSESRLKELERLFLEAVDREVTKPHDAAVEKLNASYGSALDQAIAAASKAANLEEALALRDEKQRIEAGTALPTGNADKPPLSLAKLRLSYSTALTRLVAERDRRTLPLQERFVAALTAMQNALTKSGDLQGALLVSEKVKTLSSQNLVLSGRKPALAKVEVEDAELMPFVIGGQVYGDRDIYLWEVIPAAFVNASFWRSKFSHAGTGKFKVTANGIVYMACTDRWADSGSGADQIGDLITQAGLEKQGWRLEKNSTASASRSGHTWVVFSRVCKAGETFAIRTEKYAAPFLIIPK